MDNSRNYYRVEYPSGDRPSFECAGRSYEVIDVSEMGLRLAVSADDPWVENETVVGTVTFRDNATCKVSGSVLRKTDDGIAIVLTEGVPLPRVLEEQRYLIKRYRRTVDP